MPSECHHLRLNELAKRMRGKGGQVCHLWCLSHPQPCQKTPESCILRPRLEQKPWKGLGGSG